VSDLFISYTNIFISLTFAANTMLSDRSHDEVTDTSHVLNTDVCIKTSVNTPCCRTYGTMYWSICIAMIFFVTVHNSLTKI